MASSNHQRKEIYYVIASKEVMRTNLGMNNSTSEKKERFPRQTSEQKEKQAISLRSLSSQ